MAVKSLNTSSSSRRRFTFKSFYQRVEEININVYRSLEPLKEKPSEGSSFFRESLMHWRELNTAEDFISFYEELMPLVQTLPQIILHRERIFSELVSRLKIEAQLSLEPILMLIAALSRDLLDQFLPFLQRLVDSLENLLVNGGDREPDILEQVFTSWSHIMMHLQKYLIQDIVYILRITTRLRFFPKDYVQEFVAEAVSFLLRNASSSQLTEGIRETVVEVAESSSPARKTAVAALWWYTMRGTSSKFHSKAEKFFYCLIDQSSFDASSKNPHGAEAVKEAITGLIDRLCIEICPMDVKIVFRCFFKKIYGSKSNCCLAYLNHLLVLLTFSLCKGAMAFDRHDLLNLIIFLTQSYIIPADCMELQDQISEVRDNILQLMLSVLDIPAISGDLTSTITLYDPVFRLTRSSVLVFVRQLLQKDPHITYAFRSLILSSMNDMIEDSPQEVVHLMLKLFENQRIQQLFDASGMQHNDTLKICKFLKETILCWTNKLNDLANDKKLLLSDVALLWGALCCYPHFQLAIEDLSSLKDFIVSLDQVLVSEAVDIPGLPTSTWQSLLGAALVSYDKVLQIRKLGSSEIRTFLLLAKKHKSSPHVLSAVADFLDSVLGDKSRSEADGEEKTLQDFHLDVVDSISIFADNLGSPNKGIRSSTLRILTHYPPLGELAHAGEEHPPKRLRTGESVSRDADLQYINVVELLLSIETTPLSIMTSRKVDISISKLETSLSSGRINDGYIPLLLNGMVGIMHNRFERIWEPAMKCLSMLLGRYKGSSWSKFIQFLDDFQSQSLSSCSHASDIVTENYHQSALVGCLNLFLASEFDCTRCTTMTALLLRCLQKIPDIAQSQSRQLMPLFLKFMGYDKGDVISIESYIRHDCKRSEWRLILKEWLSLVLEMRNARSLFRSQALKEVLIQRLLDDTDPDIQLLALDCLLNWKDDFLLPYHQNLRNLIIPKNLREELTSWAISKESENIQEGHRVLLVPIVVRLLTPKVRKLKSLGSRKHTGVSHRKAVLCFLAQLETTELQLFFELLLKPLLPKFLMSEVCEDQNAGVGGAELFTLQRCSNITSVANVSWKQIIGFIHVVEEILRNFDESHIKPFLSLMMMIVVRVLDRCMLDLANEGTSKVKAIEGCTSADVMGMSTKEIKDARSLSLKTIALALNKYKNHDFGSNFWDIFFSSTKPLIDSFQQEGSSSEKPSSLFLCFMAMSQSPMLVTLLAKEANLIPSIFSMLTVRTASDAILSSVLSFIENLLSFDNDEDLCENDTIKRIVLPHLEVLIHSLHKLLESGRDFHRKSVIWPEKKEHTIFKPLVKYISDPTVAMQFLDILLPLFKRKYRKSEECREGLHVVKAILPILPSQSSGRVLSAIHLLLVSAESELRLCICDIVNSLVLIDPTLSFLARILCDLNAISEVGELDYDTRVNAYHTINLEFFSDLKEEHALVILSQCVFDMSSVELILRQSACRALMSFIHFAALVMNRESRDLPEEAMSIDRTENDVAHMTIEQNQTITWTNACIQRTVKKVILRYIGEAMTKDLSQQKEWIALLRDAIYNLRDFPHLSSLRPLCSEDPEVDFFNNILHLQAHRRRRALSRFRNALAVGNFAEDMILKIFLPLFLYMLFDVKDGKGEDLRNACLETLASISGHLQWESYRAFLMRCFHEMVLKPDKEKILLRLVCAIIDAFHFFNVSSNEGMEESVVEVSRFNLKSSFSTGFSGSSVPVDVQTYLQRTVLPQIQKLLTADSEKVNVNISLAALKLLKFLPADIMESQLSSIIHRICGFLKSRLESLRDEARSALVASVKELGLEYLYFIIKVLQAILKRGYELHVLGYTLNFILSKSLAHSIVGKLDYCLEELVAIAESDILGDVAEEKEVDKIASKMKETRKNKSFETLQLIAQNVTFGTNAMKLLSPVNSHLHKHLTPKNKARLEKMLHSIAVGIQSNPSTSLSELLVFIYGLIEDSITSGLPTEETTLSCASKKFLPGMTKHKSSTLSCTDRGVNNSYLVTVFALDLLHKRLKNLKLNKRDEQMLSMLDPFMKLLGDCLTSKYEDVLEASFRCLALLVRLPLPSLEAQADNIKSLLLDIAQKTGNSRSLLVQSSLRLLTVLLRGTRISLSNDHLLMLTQFPLFIEIQTKPSQTALSLLKSIIGRKLIIPEIYDIVRQIAELMVMSQTEPIRRKCSQILLKFLIDYPLSDKCLQQHMDFLLQNLRYEHASGREAVLEMLHTIIKKFPKGVIDSQSKTFFLHLVVVLANDHDLHKLVATVIEELLNQISHKELYGILEFCLSWYKSENQQLWSAAAEVLSLLVEALKDGFRDRIVTVLQVVRNIFQSSVHAAGNNEVNFSNDPTISSWKEVYYSLVLLKKILIQFAELQFSKDIEDIWLLVCELLLHQHIWVRNISSSIIATYFIETSRSEKEHARQHKETFYLLYPGRAFGLAVSFLCQLKTTLLDDEASRLVASNLAFVVTHLHALGEVENSSVNYYWSSLDSHEKGSYIKAFELLGSQKAKTAFLLTTSSGSHLVGKKDGTDRCIRDNLQSLLVIPLLKRMGKVALTTDDIQMKTILNCYAMISQQTDSEGFCHAYAVQLLIPLYKLCEGFAGKVVSDEMKHLAEVVRDKIREKMKNDDFVKVYNSIWKNLKQKRDKRRQMQKLIATINPERHAKRKLRLAAKNRVHKKRKVMAFKMEKWRR